MSQKLAKARLQKELSEFKKGGKQKEAIEMSVGMVNDNLYHWEGILYGAKDTLYENGVFKFDVKFPKDYPMNAPKINFITKVYHPNVNLNSGEICIDILKDKWNPVYTLSQVMISIASMLSDPNPDSALNADAARLYRNDQKAYQAEVRKYVMKYAGADKL